jgi:PKD repeat protein
MADNGSTYRCVVSNTAGTATSNSATLTVLDGTPPVISQLAASAITQTAATISWQTNEPADGQAFYRRSGTTSYLQTSLASSLTTAHSRSLAGLQAATTYEYFVQSADAAGNESSSTPIRTFTTAAPNQPPVASLTAVPTSGDRPLVVSFNGSSSSDPDGSIASRTWDFGDGGSGSGVTVSHTYSVAGSYVATLTVTDTAGASDSASVTILVTDPIVAPSITTQPVGRTVNEGQSATFSITASGTAPLAYRWQRGGVDIAGATQASYTTPAASMADNGSTYRCIVSNTAGTATSNPATLTVRDVTAPVISQIGTSGVTTSQATVTWVTDEPSNSQVFYRPTGTSTYQQTTIAPALVVNHSVALQGLQSGRIYEYHVRSADQAGNAAVSTDRSFTTGSPANQPPVASFTANPTSGDAPLDVAFNGSASSDTDGSVVSWSWTFGDGGTASGVTTSHRFVSAGSYAVTLTVADDDGALSSTARTIDVVQPTLAPAIVEEPLDATVAQGMTPTFSVSATGTPPLSYQWRKNGANIQGATGTSYTTPPVTLGDDSSAYRCVVTNAAGSTLTRSAVLQVNPPGPRATGTVVLYTFDEGQGDVVGDLSGRGQPLDLAITDTRDVSWVPSGLSIDVPTVLDSGAAATKVRNAVGASNEITVEAWLSPADTTQGGPARVVTISSNGNNRNAALGQEADQWRAHLRTTVKGNSGAPPLASPAGSAIDTVQHVVFTRDSSGLERMFVDGEELSSQIETGSLSNWDDRYRLFVANEISANRPWLGVLYLVAVYDRALSLPEIDQNYAAGPHATAPNRPPVVDVTADTTSGDAPLTVRFDASGSSDPDGTIVSYTWTFGDGTNGGGIGPTHVYSAGGNYVARVTATDDRGASASATLDIAVATPPLPPTIAVQPADLTIVEGQTATFRVTAQGTPPLTYQWRRDGTAIPGATAPAFTTPPATMADHGSNYRCAVSNLAGSVTSAAATLTVIDGSVPVISQVQVTGVTETRATIGWNTNEPATTRVYYRVSGSGAFQSTPLVSTPVTSHSVQLQGLVSDTVYDYRVESADATGNTASSPTSVFSTAAPPPNQPPNASFTTSATSGEAPLNVLFNAGASSDPDGSLVSYSWTFGDGATGGGTTPSHVYTSAGAFTVTLTVVDDGGASDSASRTISVTLFPVTISVQPVDQDLAEGDQATFTVVASGSSPLTYRWKKNGELITGATGRSYTTPPVTLADDGATYRCVVSNLAGAVASDLATLTVADGTGPVIGQVVVSGITATTARITWTTDEPASSRVIYRRVGDSGWLQSPLDPSLITGHDVQIQALTPATTYEFRVRSVDVDGNVSTSPDQQFDTAAGTGLPGTVPNLRRTDKRN